MLASRFDEFFPIQSQRLNCCFSSFAATNCISDFLAKANKTGRV